MGTALGEGMFETKREVLPVYAMKRELIYSSRSSPRH